MDIPPSFALPLSPILLPDTRPDTHPTGGRPTPRLSPLSPGPRAQCSTDRNLPVLRARTDCTQAYPQNPPHSSLPPIVVCVQTCKTPPPGKGRGEAALLLRGVGGGGPHRRVYVVPKKTPPFSRRR